MSEADVVQDLYAGISSDSEEDLPVKTALSEEDRKALEEIYKEPASEQPVAQQNNLTSKLTSWFK